LSALRCDIVCKCTVQGLGEPQTVVLYFDIEMQRENIPGRIEEFLKYRQLLEEQYKKGEVKVVAFLDYQTDKAVEMTSFQRVIKKGSDIVPAEDVTKLTLYPMVGLKRTVHDIFNGKDIEVIDGKLIGNTGKEWLKLLGIRHWGRRKDPKNRKCEYYVVPAITENNSKQIMEALEFLREENLNELKELFQNQVDMVFDAKKSVARIQAKGLQEGEKRG
jgi:hypothetical protein